MLCVEVPCRSIVIDISTNDPNWCLIDMIQVALIIMGTFIGDCLFSQSQGAAPKSFCSLVDGPHFAPSRWSKQCRWGTFSTISVRSHSRLLSSMAHILLHRCD